MNEKLPMELAFILEEEAVMPKPKTMEDAVLATATDRTTRFMIGGHLRAERVQRRRRGAGAARVAQAVVRNDGGVRRGVRGGRRRGGDVVTQITPTVRIACQRCAKRRAAFVVSRRRARLYVCGRCRRPRGEALRARIVAA